MPQGSGILKRRIQNISELYASLIGFEILFPGHRFHGLPRVKDPRYYAPVFDRPFGDNQTFTEGLVLSTPATLRGR